MQQSDRQSAHQKLLGMTSNSDKHTHYFENGDILHKC